MIFSICFVNSLASNFSRRTLAAESLATLSILSEKHQTPYLKEVAQLEYGEHYIVPEHKNLETCTNTDDDDSDGKHDRTVLDRGLNLGTS